MKKYVPGRQIKSLDVLMQQEFVIWATKNYAKTYHREWVASWPLRNTQALIDGGVLFEARPNPDYKIEKKVNFWEAVHHGN